MRLSSVINVDMVSTMVTNSNYSAIAVTYDVPIVCTKIKTTRYFTRSIDVGIF